VKEEVASFYFF